MHTLGRAISSYSMSTMSQSISRGLLASMTWYHHPGKLLTDPAAYVDAETVPYLVVPPIVVKRTRGIVRGCKARATFRGKSVDCVVADRGPANRIGELSIAAARALGLPSSPRNGGTEQPEVLYELWPGMPAPGFVLQPALSERRAQDSTRAQSSEITR